MPQIQEMLLSPGPNRPGSIITPDLIIVHRTGNPGASALANQNYFESLNHPPKAGKTHASAHYIIDSNYTIRCIPERERAHHCIGANTRSIGIEVCEPLTCAAYQSLLDLIWDICQRYGITADPSHVQPHSKYDDTRRRYDPFRWADYQQGRTTSADLFDPFQFYRDLEVMA